MEARKRESVTVPAARQASSNSARMPRCGCSTSSTMGSLLKYSIWGGKRGGHPELLPPRYPDLLPNLSMPGDGIRVCVPATFPVSPPRSARQCPPCPPRPPPSPHALPGDALSLVLRLLLPQDQFDEELLQLLIAVVDAELLEAAGKGVRPVTATRSPPSHPLHTP